MAELAKAAIAKIDQEKRRVFGWANVSFEYAKGLVVDSQDMLAFPQDLEEAAYHFVLEYRGTGEMHVGKSKGRLIESFMVTPEKLEAMGLKSDALPIGMWVGFQIEDDEAWEKVKLGVYKMFSIQGTAQLEEVNI